jgi:hypothetical protein
MKPTFLRNFITHDRHSVQPAVTNGQQTDPPFKKCLNYVVVVITIIIIIIITITISAAAQRGYYLHSQLSSSLLPSEPIV